MFDIVFAYFELFSLDHLDFVQSDSNVLSVSNLKSDSDLTCNICDMKFDKPRSLANHKGKKHPGSSIIHKSKNTT